MCLILITKIIVVVLNKNGEYMENTNPVQALKDRIIAWEHNAGESFTDYFMHDNVADRSWAFWLLGKGYTSRANEIIEEIVRQESNKIRLCLDQELLYDVHGQEPWDEEAKTYNWNQENYDKNVMLWSEFLLATALYTGRVEEFFKEEGF